MEFPQTLFSRDRTGELRSWKVWTEGDTIVSEYGRVEGALQKARKLAVPKNVDRSNETTAEEQALIEAIGSEEPVDV